jgi:hypothetical protein
MANTARWVHLQFPFLRARFARTDIAVYQLLGCNTTDFRDFCAVVVKSRMNSYLLQNAFEARSCAYVGPGCGSQLTHKTCRTLPATFNAASLGHGANG